MIMMKTNSIFRFVIAVALVVIGGVLIELDFSDVIFEFFARAIGFVMIMLVGVLVWSA